MTTLIAPVTGRARKGHRSASVLLDELIADNFAGGGGASTGIEAAVGRAVDIAVNHDPASVEMHSVNHPATRHYRESVWDVDPVKATGGRSVGLAWFSPDCKHFSRAKGGKPVEKKIRGLAWIVVKWAKLVRPRVIILENVREFETWGPLTPENRPCPLRKGETFRRWRRQLENLGYAVEHRVLNAADYGAPTHRRRLFLVARCDGNPIVWPEPTHGPGRKPYRTAAECIDWSIPCPSIFGRKKPLAEKTMRRIALGIKRYVLDNPKPFIVPLTHHGDRRVHTMDEPFPTVTGANRGELALVSPTLVECANSNWSVGSRPVDGPAPTVTARPKGGSWALVSAFLAKHYGGVVGHEPDRPIGTVTAVDHHSVVAAHLTKFYGTNVGSDPREPAPTVTATGQHIGAVYAFLMKYYSSGNNPTQNCASLLESMPTATAKDRISVITVTVDGEPYVIADIGLRMLTPRELARAQGFPDSYVLTGTKSNQVARIGNSVCPVMAEVLVRANFVEIAA